MINTLFNPYLLFLLLPLVLLLFLAWKRRSGAIVIPSLNIYEKTCNGKEKFNLRKFIPLFFYALCGISIIFAMTQPREGLEEIRRRSEGIDIILAIDLSGSMAVYDAPDGAGERAVANSINSGKLKNRLETAKKEIREFIDKRPGDRIGLIAFAPLAYVACPPTLDHGYLLAHLDDLKLGMIGDRTGLAAPVASAAKRLKDSDSKRKIVVLFTDGVNNVQAKVSPLQAAKLADTVNVTVYTVGIGGSNSFAVQQDLFGSRLAPVQQGFDEALLKEMAKISGGKYYHAADAQGMKNAMKEIDKLEKTSVEQIITVNWKEFYPVFAILGVIFLMTGFFLEHSFCLRLP
ncbi:MAG: VWA domain-containing protein [Lentisphaeria bacterium]|nr:VWA domain-containing protein [Lentisphaeria bacterium]